MPDRNKCLIDYYECVKCDIIVFFFCVWFDWLWELVSVPSDVIRVWITNIWYRWHCLIIYIFPSVDLQTLYLYSKIVRCKWHGEKKRCRCKMKFDQFVFASCFESIVIQDEGKTQKKNQQHFNKWNWLMSKLENEAARAHTQQYMQTTENEWIFGKLQSKMISEIKLQEVK